MNISPKTFKVSWLGKFIYYTLRYRKSTIESNINIVYGSTLSKKNKQILVQAFYSHFIQSIKEIFLLYFFYKNRTQRKISIQGLEYLQHAIQQERGVLILSAHIGNIQYAPVLASKQLKKIGAFHVVLKTIKVKWLETLVYSGFSRAGISILKSQGEIKHIPKILKNNGLVFFAFDQHAKLDKNQGIAVPFFGKLAGTYRSLALFAQRYKACVVPGIVYRDSNNQHVMEFFPEILWNSEGTRQQQIKTNTQRYNEVLEQLILQHPDQWLWSHRRWKLN
jgi:KDO2-lipid IV(A) lauroyltransferase